MLTIFNRPCLCHLERVRGVTPNILAASCRRIKSNCMKNLLFGVSLFRSRQRCPQHAGFCVGAFFSSRLRRVPEVSQKYPVGALTPSIGLRIEETESRAMSNKKIKNPRKSFKPHQAALPLRAVAALPLRPGSACGVGNCSMFSAPVSHPPTSITGRVLRSV